MSLPSSSARQKGRRLRLLECGSAGSPNDRAACYHWAFRCAAMLVASLLLATVGCRQITPPPKIKLAYVNWADGTALTYLVQAVLEEKLGYRVELTMADAAPVFTSVADGGYDAFVDAWVPVTHADYIERYSDTLVDLGPNYQGTRIGLVVPDYVDAESIADLAQTSERFGKRIVGIDSGAGIMKATERAIDQYQLDLRLLPSSEAAMAASLKEAIDRREPIVVTGWKPHWMFARWPLRFLNDPHGVFAGSENIHTVVREGFVKDHPDAANFLRNFQVDAEQLQELMDQMRNPDSDPEIIARRWIESHPDVVSRWLEKSDR